VNLEGWHCPRAFWLDVADHTFVLVRDPTTGAQVDFFGCWWPEIPPGSKQSLSAPGDYDAADCYRCPLPFFGDTACIGIYAVNGVCHQSANCFLYSTGKFLNDFANIKALAASYAWYGVWGTAFIGWLAVYGGCRLLGRSGSVSTTATDTDDATFDELATATEPDNDARLFDVLVRLHGRANRSTNPNVTIVAAFREIMAYHVPELRGFDGFVAPHAQYLRDKDSLTERYVGTELVQRLNESGRAMLEQLRSLIGVGHYTTLMGTDKIMNIVDPELSNAAGYSDVQPTYDATFISQNVPTLMIADGRRYPVSIKIHNSGNQVWRPGRIRLRSENPTDNLTWGTNRVDLPGGANVSPQSDVTFSFDVTPQTLGEQLFRWGMIRENVGPFGQKNAPVKVMVAKDALFLRQSVPATIVAGTTQPASVTFRNIGTVQWTRGANFRLGSQGLANNTIWGLYRVELPHDVPAGTEVIFDFPIKAPAAAGKYNFQWQVLQEQVAWLGQPSPAFEVRVMPPLARAAVFVSQTVPTHMTPASTRTVSVTMRNVGTETWTPGTQYKLGSQNPPDNTRWAINRVAVPQDVPPNAEVIFSFSIQARNTTGIQSFQWQMVQENVEWFGQKTPNIDVKVAPGPSEGTFVQATDTGAVYRIAGGAPIYVSNWAAFGGPQPVSNIADAVLRSLSPYPADGTFIAGAQRGEVYRVAGGAPIYVSNWAAFGGPQPTVTVDQVAIDNAGTGGLWNHLRATPADGTFIAGAQTGAVYRVSNGHPTYVPSWEPFGGVQPHTFVDQAAIDNAGGTGAWSHLR
jgi:hypothetical protein